MSQKIKHNRSKYSNGFTLIEVIIAIIIAALLGAMIIQHTGTNLTATVKSLVATHNNTDAVSLMEQITRDYRNWLEDSPDETILDFETNIINSDDYSGIQTDIIAPGELRDDDPDDSILRVTVTRGDRELVSLFTK
ncbi:MAG: prepilin-type N-terminal cleavage/methylation domain-containing protein [Desulfobacterales bacterium]